MFGLLKSAISAENGPPFIERLCPSRAVIYFARLSSLCEALLRRAKS